MCVYACLCVFVYNSPQWHPQWQTFELFQAQNQAQLQQQLGQGPGQQMRSGPGQQMGPQGQDHVVGVHGMQMSGAGAAVPGGNGGGGGLVDTMAGAGGVSYPAFALVYTRVCGV